MYAALTKPAGCSQEDFDHIVKRLAAELEALGVGKAEALHRQDLDPLELDPTDSYEAVPYPLPAGSNRIAVVWTKAAILERAKQNGTPITRREAERVIERINAEVGEWDDIDLSTAVSAEFIDDTIRYVRKGLA